MARPKKKPQNRGRNKMKMFQAGQPGQTTTPVPCNPKKRKLDEDSNADARSKKNKTGSPADSEAVKPINSCRLVRAKPCLQSLPPETIQEIFKHTDQISGACLALTCRYLFSNGKKYEVSCPPVKGKYSQDRDRLAFMKLLKDLMPEDHRLCWMCRKWKPINGGRLILYEYEGVAIKKRTSKPPKGECKFEKTKEEWKDDDWTFLSIGACKSKDRKIRTRTYCPRCTAAIHEISLM